MKEMLNYHKMFAVELIGKTINSIILDDSGKLIGLITKDKKVILPEVYKHTLENDLLSLSIESLEKYKVQNYDYNEIIISKNEDGTFKYEEV